MSALVQALRNALVIMAPMLDDDAATHGALLVGRSTLPTLREQAGEAWRDLDAAPAEFEAMSGFHVVGAFEGILALTPDPMEEGHDGIIIQSAASLDMLGGVVPLRDGWTSYHIGGDGSMVIHPDSA